MNGRVILVVGPSGVGKDTLIDGVKERLTGNDIIKFPKRIITRPADAIGEDHLAVTEHEFGQMRLRGQFVLDWNAHGLRYGIPMDVADWVASGKHAVINISRAAIDTARSIWDTRIISVMVPEKHLRQRLEERGRESQTQIEARLKRAHMFSVTGPDVVEFINDCEKEKAVHCFSSLIGWLGQCPQHAVAGRPGR